MLWWVKEGRDRFGPYLHIPIKEEATKQSRERNLSGRRAFRKHPCLKGFDVERGQ